VTANSSAQVVSSKPAIFNSVSSNVFRWLFQLGAWVKNNQRFFWAVSLSWWNPLNGFAFVYNQKKFQVVKYTAWVWTFVDSIEFSNQRWWMPENNLRNEYEIEYDNGFVCFCVNGKPIHKETAWNNLLSWGFQLPIFMKNVNSNGSIVNVSMNASWVAIFRKWEVEAVPLYQNITVDGTYTLKNNAGILKAIMVNSTAGTLCTIYDNTSATWTKIWTIQLNQIFSWLPNGGAFFTNWLTLVTTGVSMDVTVIRE
jgi:hypothetical protein